MQKKKDYPTKMSLIALLQSLTQAMLTTITGLLRRYSTPKKEQSISHGREKDMPVIKQQIEALIQRVLEKASLSSEQAVELLLHTGAVESGYGAIKQHPKGPATSFWQVEPFTACDIWKNYLVYRTSLRAKIVKASNIPERFMDELPSIEDCEELLHTNLAFAILMARLVYRRIPKALPNVGDMNAQAKYWLKYYNAGGKGTESKFLYANM
jgi:hypothetical protein